jgi:hypothetical protein
MKALLLAAMAALALSACGKRVVSADAEIQGYVETWEAFEGVPNTYTIEFKTLESITVAGRCNYGGAIHLNDVVWPTLSPTRREALIWHELKHCVQGYAQHDDTRDERTECPASYMSTKLISERCFNLIKQRGTL